jgi:hypothetical protein
LLRDEVNPECRYETVDSLLKSLNEQEWFKKVYIFNNKRYILYRFYFYFFKKMIK